MAVLRIETIIILDLSVLTFFILPVLSLAEKTFVKHPRCDKIISATFPVERLFV